MFQTNSEIIQVANSETIHILEVVGNAIVGGVERYTYNLARYLPERGFKVTCVAPYESPVTAGLREIGSPVYVTSMDDDPSWRSIQFLTELVRQQRVDLIHAHLPRAQVLSGLAGCLTGVPVVMTIHGMDISSWELGILRATGSTLSVVCQQAYLQALSLGMPAGRVRLIPNGVDLDAFRPQPNREETRQALNLPAQAPLVGFVGRLSWEKGPDMFLKLAQHVLKKNAEIHFVIFGDGPMKVELAQEIGTTGMQDRLHLAGVWEDMPSAYAALDMLVQTSRVEGMPFTLLEGMACGLPVAAMNAGGVPEIIEVGSCGYLSAQGDWAGLGEAVLNLIADPALRKRMGLAARRRVEQKFDLNSCIELLAQEFRNLLPARLLAGKLEKETLPATNKMGGFEEGILKTAARKER